MSFVKISNDGTDKIRADLLLANTYPQYSRASLSKLFDMNLVKSSKKIIKPGDKILPSNVIYVDISPINKVAKKINIPILYEDSDIIVVDKPVGLISHARGKYWDEPSVASFIRDKVSGLEGERAGIVHRLDRATSGVMVCAKNPKALSFLQKQFSKRNVKKTYYALVSGTLNPKKGLIDVPIARNPKKPQTFIASSLGKNAQTVFEVMCEQNNVSAIQLNPKTGRTHQLRIHLSFMGKPIIGDILYGGIASERLMLHAYSITINTLNSGEKTFNSPIPNEFTKLCKTISTLNY